MTHILFISYHYPPENGAEAMRISESARHLVESGNQVTVLTSVPNYPTGIVPAAYRGRLVRVEEKDGVRIIYVWCYVTPAKRFVRRVLAQLSFALFVPLLGFKEIGNPDLIIADSPPLFNGISGRMLAWIKHCPFIFTISDLWPEVAIQMGMLRSRIVIRIAEWVEWSTYRSAAFVWVVTSGLRDILVQRGLPPERVFVLINGVDCAKFRPLSKIQARAKLGWDDRFTLLYAGGHGPSHGLGTVLDAAEQVLDHKDIHIVLVGDGGEKEHLIQEAQRRGLDNITFLGVQPHDTIPLLLAASDACLALATKAILFQGVMPTKMYEAMASARPTILMVDGEAKRIAVDEAGAAVYAEPENPAALASAIIYLWNHPAEVELLGQRGRAFAEMHFDRRQLVAKLDERIIELLTKSDSKTELPKIIEAVRLKEPAARVKPTQVK